MNQFLPILPEVILTVGAILLMMVAAFTGRRGAAVTSWGAVALLIGATVALIGPPSEAGAIFGGLLAADLFGAFGKALIFPAAAVAIIAALGWFERDAEHSPEYPVLILLSSVGMAVMVSATNMITLYIGLELLSLSSYVLASYRRSDERSAEAGLKYFVLGALASGILLYGISLLYGFTGRRLRSRRAVAGAPARPSLPARRHRLQGERRSVPHVDAGRLRRRADAGYGLLRLGT
jgi:NADH-quinone oxidoreductase subunit N